MYIVASLCNGSHLQLWWFSWPACSIN